MSQTEKPNVLILGGLNTASRALAAFLAPPGGESLVNTLRIADKYIVVPATTYIGAQFSEVLKSPVVEYLQANLINPATVTKIFEPPEGQKPYSYVFDFTGEIRYDRSDPIQIDQTVKLSRGLGLEAAKRKVKAYVRLHFPYYDTPLEKKLSDENDKPKPLGVRGVWWHEALRSLAAIKDLNLVVIRTGSIYGPHVLYDIVTPRIILGAVYKFLDDEMKYLWSAQMHMNTVHVEDVAGAMWACAKWIEPLGREAADKAAGVEIYFANEKSKVKEVEGLVSPSENPICPFFNLVDDSNSTQQSMGQAVANVFGIKFGFHSMVSSTLFKLDIKNQTEEVNETHMEAWTQMITTSKPPVINTPLTVYLDEHMLAKFSIAYSGQKIKDIVGYKLRRPKFDEEGVKEVVEAFKLEGSWPIME